MRPAGTIVAVPTDDETELAEDLAPDDRSLGDLSAGGPSTEGRGPRGARNGDVPSTAPIDHDEPPVPERISPEAAVDAVDDLLDEVEQALSRLDDGTYGQCSSCGAPIDGARLAADPTADLCVDCRSSGH